MLDHTHETLGCNVSLVDSASASPIFGQLLAPLPKQVLTFRLSEQEYGVDILNVQEIRGYSAPIRIASTPPHIKGIINLRGVIVPILDLRLWFNCYRADYDSLTAVVILSLREKVVGAVVDAVSDVLTLQSEDIKLAPDLGSSQAPNHILGIAYTESSHGARPSILLDMESLVRKATFGPEFMDAG